MAKFLLQKKAYPTIALRDKSSTPITIACQNGHRDIVELILRGGFNVNSIMDIGLTLLHIAVIYDKLEVVNYLLDDKADINSAIKSGATPLYLACYNNHYRIVDNLITRGADINIPEKIGTTPLHVSCQKGHLKIVKLVLNIQNINSADEAGHTPLFIAASHNRYDVVKLLIEKKADIYIANKEGKTCLDYVKSSGHEQILKVLTESAREIPDDERLRKNISQLPIERWGTREVNLWLDSKGLKIHQTDKKLMVKHLSLWRLANYREYWNSLRIKLKILKKKSKIT